MFFIKKTTTKYHTLAFHHGQKQVMWVFPEGGGGGGSKRNLAKATQLAIKIMRMISWE